MSKKNKNKRRKKVKAKMAKQKAHQRMLRSHMSKKYNDQIETYIKAQLEAQNEQIENTEDGVVEVIKEIPEVKRVENGLIGDEIEVTIPEENINEEE